MLQVVVEYNFFKVWCIMGIYEDFEELCSLDAHEIEGCSTEEEIAAACEEMGIDLDD